MNEIIYNCHGGTNGDQPTQISTSDLNEVLGLMLNQLPTPGDKKLSIGMYAYISTDLTKMVKDLFHFIPAKDYPSGTQIMPGELGCSQNIRFIWKRFTLLEPRASKNKYDVSNVDIVCTSSQEKLNDEEYLAKVVLRCTT